MTVPNSTFLGPKRCHRKHNQGLSVKENDTVFCCEVNMDTGSRKIYSKAGFGFVEQGDEPLTLVA